MGQDPTLQVLPPGVPAMPLGVIQDDELRLYLADLQAPAVEVGVKTVIDIRWRWSNVNM